MRILLDTNVLIDMYARRQPFEKDAGTKNDAAKQAEKIGIKVYYPDDNGMKLVAEMRTVEATGGAFKLANMVIKLVGEKHPEIAMAIMGWVVSIPVFCDSGFVILNPIRMTLDAAVRRTMA